MAHKKLYVVFSTWWANVNEMARHELAVKRCLRRWQLKSVVTCLNQWVEVATMRQRARRWLQMAARKTELGVYRRTWLQWLYANTIAIEEQLSDNVDELQAQVTELRAEREIAAAVRDDLAAAQAQVQVLIKRSMKGFANYVKQWQGRCVSTRHQPCRQYCRDRKSVV